MACLPDCALGTFVSTPAAVKLADPVQTVDGREFAQLTYTYADPTAPGGVATHRQVLPATEG